MPPQIAAVVPAIQFHTLDVVSEIHCRVAFHADWMALPAAMMEPVIAFQMPTRNPQMAFQTATAVLLMLVQSCSKNATQGSNRKCAAATIAPQIITKKPRMLFQTLVIQFQTSSAHMRIRLPMESRAW